MSFFGTLTKLFHSPGAATATQIGTTIAASAAAGVNPGLGALVAMLGNAIYAVEVSSPGSAGAAKKDAVKAIVDTTAPVTLQVLQQISGKPVTDPAAVAPSLDRLIDDLVQFFNALGVFTHTNAAASLNPAQLITPTG